jgi:hypothetical protein
MIKLPVNRPTLLSGSSKQLSQLIYEVNYEPSLSAIFAKQILTCLVKKLAAIMEP